MHAGFARIVPERQVDDRGGNLLPALSTDVSLVRRVTNPSTAGDASETFALLPGMSWEDRPYTSASMAPANTPGFFVEEVR